MNNHTFTKNDFNRVWFTSDNHFGHENIIRYCKRPFVSSQQMNAAMIENWNKVVKQNDIVYHLGDITLGDNAFRYLDKLNGAIYIIETPWHHDKRWIRKQKPKIVNELPVIFLHPLHIIRITDLRDRPFPITLSHYPMAEWEASFYETWHLHGHSHGNHIPGEYRFALDVGVDCMNFYPVNLGGVLEAMYGLGWVC